jgi:hypothetical protein
MARTVRYGSPCQQSRGLTGEAPDLADFYKIEVARRGTVAYSYEQLQQKAWSVELSLGTTAAVEATSVPGRSHVETSGAVL